MSRNYYRHLIGGAAPAPTGLFANAVAYYKLDENSGQAIDAINGYNGDLFGGVTQGASGKIGNAYQLDGSSGYISAPNNNDFTMTDGTDLNDVPFTLRCWLNFYSLSANQWLINKRGAFDNLEYQIQYVNSQLRLDIFNKNNSQDFIRASIQNLNLITNQWYHLVTTYDGSKLKEGMSIYLNGADLTNARQVSGYIYEGMGNGNSDLVIGKAAWDPVLYFNGKIDEICIIKNEAWTPAQVAEDYNNGLGTTI